MEKRLVTFLVLSVLILTGHVLIRSMLSPPQREVAQQGDDDDQLVAERKQADTDSGDTDSGKGESKEEQKPARQETDREGDTDPAPPAKQAQTPDVESTVPEAKKVPATPAEPEKWFTLVSFDPITGRPVLRVTISNRGAAIERVELVERDDKGRLRHRDLIRTYGHLGLYTRDTKQGCVVKVVGPGTPADLATQADQNPAGGFKSGDVIAGADGTEITSKADLDAFLENTKAGRKVTFNLLRDGAEMQLRATLDQWPLQLVQPETPARRDSEPTRPSAELFEPHVAVADAPMISSFLVGLHSVGSTIGPLGQDELDGVTSLRHSIWKVAQPNENEIVFSKRVQLSGEAGGDELEFLRRYKVALPAAQIAGDGGQENEDTASADTPNAAYHLQMDIEIHNHGARAQTVSYVMDGPNGLPLEGWWYTNKIHPSWGSAGARDVVWRVHGNKHSLRSATQIYKESREKAEEAGDDPDTLMTSILTDSPSPEERTLDYLGVDTQYFSAVLLAGTMTDPKAFTCQQAYSMPIGKLPELKGRGMKKLNTSYRMVSVATPIEPGTSVIDQYHLFLGPKSTEVLAAYDLPEMIEYGWFGKIAKPLSWLLHFFYGIFRNYGLAIVLLTVLVRGAMFPIGRKAARNAQVMQELAPEIKKIKEKYKNDLEKQGQAQRELWKKNNFNPLSGCWLMFLQLPIFIGLYRCLSVDINLRQAPLIPGIRWCSNLSGPDMAWHWQGIVPDFFASETGWLGPYLNILPIITIVLFIAQQKMFTPPATDEQTQMQQKMMKYMMIFMGVMFFKVPAGLCVYFVASSLWGIGERKLLPKPKPAAQSSSPKKKSWLERIRSKAEPDPAERARQRRKRRK